MKKFVNSMLTALVLSIAAGAFFTLTAVAQTQSRVDVKKDWSIFEAGEGASKICWIVSQPTKSVARRGGQTVQVRRSDIFLMVAIRPNDGVKNEVSFIAGYPFKKGSKVEAKVGRSDFSLFTDGENAWMPSAKADDGVVAAFRRGATARITGVSSRGTTTVDTFSLSGFTAALKAAHDLCK